MKERKNIYLLIFLSVIICVSVLFFLANPFKKEALEYNGHKLGTFSYEKAGDYIDFTDEYDPSLETGSELDDNNAFVTNYNLLYDFLSIEAAGRLSPCVASFLNEHGYGGYHELTIQKDTIIADESYPRFVCEIDETGKYLEIRYRSDLREFEFNFLDRPF